MRNDLPKNWTPSGTSIVPNVSHYGKDYACGRIFSLAHQLDQVLKLDPSNVIEIGTGTKIVATALKILGVQVVTVDLESTLVPTIIGTVLKLPIRDRSFDVSLCCQVLEHLPFETFQCALGELRRVSCRGLVLSLPDSSRFAEASITFPGVGKWHRAWSPPRFRSPSFPRKRLQDLGHYWEIGYAGFELSRVNRIIEAAQWRIERSWRVPELKWHRFFLLR